jgi:hypothetical protein
LRKTLEIRWKLATKRWKLEVGFFEENDLISINIAVADLHEFYESLLLFTIILEDKELVWRSENEPGVCVQWVFM